MALVGHRDPRHGILCECLACLPDEPAAAALRLRSIAEGDWPAFLEYVAGHGVLGVLRPALDLSDLPPPTRLEIERRLLVQSMWAQQVSETLAGVLDRFARAGVRICTLKGPPLAERLYGDRSARPSIDVDVLVDPSRLDTARAVLESDGYRGDSDVSAAYLLAHAHHLHFTRQGAPEIELHFEAYHGFGTRIPAAALMSRGQPYLFDGRHTLVASPEDELIYLAVHAAGHSFIRLLWLNDMKMLVLRQPIDWDAVVSRSADLRVAVVVAYALRLLGEWLDVSGIPARATCRRSGPRTRLADNLLDVVAAPSRPSSMDNLGGLVFTAMLCDRVGATVGLTGHHLLRTARHRVHRLAPRLVPESWSA